MKQCWLLFFSLFILWEATAQKISLSPKTAHRDNLTMSDIAPNNKYFASLDTSGLAIIWDIANGAQMMQLKGIRGIAFAANSQSLYVSHKDLSFSRVGLNGKLIESLSTKTYKIDSDIGGAFYPLSDIYLLGGHMFDIRKGYLKKLGMLNKDFGTEQDYSPVLNQIAMAGYNGWLSLMDGSTGAVVHKIKTDISITNWTPPKVFFSRNGEAAVVFKPDSLSVVDIAAGKVIKTIVPPKTNFFAAHLSPDGKTVAWVEEKKIVSYNIAQNKIRWSVAHPFSSRLNLGGGTLKFNEAGDKILAGSGGEFVWMDALTGKIEKTFYGEAVGFYHSFTLDKENMKMRATQNYERIFSWDLRSGAMEPFDTSCLYTAGKVIKDVDFSIRKYPKKGRSSVDVSPDGRYIMSFPDEKCKEESQSEILVYDRITKKNVFSKPCGFTETRFVNTKPYIALVVDKNPHRDLEIYDLTTGAKIHTFPNLDISWSSGNMYFSPDDRYFIAQTKTQGFTIADLETKEIKTIPPEYLQTFNPNFHGSIWGFTPDGKYVVLALDALYFMELASGKVNPSLTLPATEVGQFGEVSFTPDGNFIFIEYTKNFTGYMCVMDRRTKKVVANLYPDIYKGNWAVVDMEGRFDGNSGVLSTMYHATDKELVPLDAMFEKFYTPRLLARILNGEKLDPIPDLNNLNKVPTVAITFSEGARNLLVSDETDTEKIMTKNGKATLTITATSPGDGVSEIRLFRNGKLVETTRNLVVEDDVKSKRELSKTYTIDLVEGANTFKAIALNSQRTESKPVELIAQYQPDKPAPSAESSFQIHLLVVGINAYKNPKYNLNYALADATAFKNVIEGGARSLFSKVNTHFITDASASKAGIMKAFNEIKTNARPNDLFVFYYAGHGVLNDAKDFFLVPHDVTQMYGKEDALENNGFSASLLQQYSKEIKAQKQLFILDACQSAGALENVVGARGALEEKAIAQLARSTGTHWLTASGSEQFASEFGQLGHGAFTWCILQALKGEADNGDKKLTIKELDAYLQHKVPDVTEKHRGSPQYPASYSYGNDFPFFIVK
ncbi:caspase family protein [Chitinophaga sp. MM2321]|uniref:caspase family protein n=1 Tax=Chitinophaga sp. MM2321 TaxID=3137178 RepID=UPI0032D59263